MKFTQRDKIIAEFFAAVNEVFDGDDNRTWEFIESSEAITAALESRLNEPDDQD